MSSADNETKPKAQSACEPGASRVGESASGLAGKPEAASTSEPGASCAGESAGKLATGSAPEPAANSAGDAAANASATAKAPAARAACKHAKRALVAGALVLCLVALMVGVRATYTAFTAGDYLKGVIVTNDTQSLFASDLLFPYSDDTTTAADQVIAVDPGDSEFCSVTFSIYNCLPADQHVVNMKDVTYLLTVSAQNCTNWTISPEAGQVTFLGGRAQVKTYTITFPRADLGTANFLVTASVQDGSPGTTLRRLAANVVPNVRATVESSSVEGTLVDRFAVDESGKTVETNVGDYDACNYRITVTSKEAKVKLSWDGEKVDLDHFFESKFNDSQYQLHVDRQNHVATLTLQPGNTVVNFYRHEGGTINSWDDLGIAVEKVE